jgi:hypothetical protein
VVVRERENTARRHPLLSTVASIFRDLVMRYCDVEAVRGVTYAVRRGTTTARLGGTAPETTRLALIASGTAATNTVGPERMRGAMSCAAPAFDRVRAAPPDLCQTT